MPDTLVNTGDGQIGDGQKRRLSLHVRDLVEVMENAASRELKTAALNEAIMVLKCVGLQFQVDERRELPASRDEYAETPVQRGFVSDAIDAIDTYLKHIAAANIAGDADAVRHWLGTCVEAADKALGHLNGIHPQAQKCGGFEDVFPGEIGVTGMRDGRLYMKGSPIAGVGMGVTPTGYVLRVGDHEILVADSELRKWLPLLDRARRSPYPGPKG